MKIDPKKESARLLYEALTTGQIELDNGEVKTLRTSEILQIAKFYLTKDTSTQIGEKDIEGFTL